MLGFVARQPIYDGRGQVFAYELLFRSGPENVFAGGDPELASRSVIHDSLEVYGFDELTGGRRAFVNVTRQVLLDRTYRRLPPQRTVLELLETVEADDATVAACAAAKKEGYLLALDDFILGPAVEPFVALADFIKIDVLATTAQERSDWFRHLEGRPVRFLAEKIETRDVFDQACADGFSYFQGYFFHRPEMLSAPSIAPHKRAALRLVGELVNGGDPDLDRLLRTEPRLAQRLLEDLNSAVNGRARVTSVREAKNVLGESAFRRWAVLVALATLGDDRPPELTTTALVRARFTRAIARQVGAGENALFLAGMLSASDAVVGRPLDEVLACLDLPQAAKEALVRPESLEGRVLGLVLDYERGHWAGVTSRAKSLGLPEEPIPSWFRDAVRWARTVYPH